MSVANASAFHPGANAFLTYVFGRGLQDEHYIVERYRSTMDGIRRLPGGKGRPLTLSLETVRELRPARNEILICKGEKTAGSGVQYWGSSAIFGYMLRRDRFPR